MSIVYEFRQWEGDVYYFQSTMGTTPICKAYRAGDGWEVMFFRGPTNLGPYPYDCFERARNHLFRYLTPREDELAGDRPHFAEGFGTSHARTGSPAGAILSKRSRRHHRGRGVRL